MVYTIGRRGPEILDWIDDIYLEWSEDDAEEVYEQNRQISGNHGFLFDDEVELQKYKGPHPSILDKHPFRNCDDVRDLENRSELDTNSAWNNVDIETKVERKLQILLRKFIHWKPL
jgi:hypothetical protein